MSTKYFVDIDGNYIGGFGSGATPPTGSIEVFNPPNHGTDKWKGNKWEEDPIEKEKKDKAKKGADAEPLLFDALLCLLGSEYDTLVDDYRQSKAAEDYLDRV